MAWIGGGGIKTIHLQVDLAIRIINGADELLQSEIKFFADWPVLRQYTRFVKRLRCGL